MSKERGDHGQGKGTKERCGFPLPEIRKRGRGRGTRRLSNPRTLWRSWKRMGYGRRGINSARRNLRGKG